MHYYFAVEKQRWVTGRLEPFGLQEGPQAGFFCTHKKETFMQQSWAKYGSCLVCSESKTNNWPFGFWFFFFLVREKLKLESKGGLDTCVCRSRFKAHCR